MAYEKRTYVIYGLWEDEFMVWEEDVIYGLWEEDVCNLWLMRRWSYVIYGLWEDDVCNLWLMRRGRM